MYVIHSIKHRFPEYTGLMVKWKCNEYIQDFRFCVNQSKGNTKLGGQRVRDGSGRTWGEHVQNILKKDTFP